MRKRLIYIQFAFFIISLVWFVLLYQQSDSIVQFNSIVEQVQEDPFSNNMVDIRVLPTFNLLTMIYVSFGFSFLCLLFWLDELLSYFKILERFGGKS